MARSKSAAAAALQLLPPPPPGSSPAPPNSGSGSAPSTGHLPEYNALTSSARLLDPVRANTPKYDQWQDQAWNFYDTLEQLEYGVSWLAKMVSRVRLVAAEVIDGGDEPVLVTGGPAAAAVSRLAGGVGGQARLMHEFTIHYSVPGVCWLVGEAPPAPGSALSQDPNAPTEETWTIYSADELRMRGRKLGGVPTYEVRVGPSEQKDWRLISPDSMVVQCWSPHPRFGWLPDSPTRHALGALVELDLVNKRIMAMILSRLASNGVLLYDKERMSFPTRTNPNDPSATSPGDLAQVFVEVAQQAMADPMSPAACIPIPIGFEIPDLTDVDPRLLMQHLTFADGVDDKLLKLRDSAIRRVATAIELPAEILLGMADMNHWGASQVEESAIKITATPVAEVIAYSLTIGYLYPMLKAMGIDPATAGPNGGRMVVWYDPSEIVGRPDKSQNAISAYDRQEISPQALRRELGVDEGDAPTEDQQINMILRSQATNGSLAALQVLNGDLALADAAPTADPGVRPTTAPGNQRGPRPPGGSDPAPSPRGSDPGDRRPSGGQGAPDPGRVNVGETANYGTRVPIRIVVAPSPSPTSSTFTAEPIAVPAATATLEPDPA